MSALMPRRCGKKKSLIQRPQQYHCGSSALLTAHKIEVTTGTATELASCLYFCDLPHGNANESGNPMMRAHSLGVRETLTPVEI